MKRVNAIFCPYIYLLSPDICKIIGLKNLIKNAIIIFDEGFHNLFNFTFVGHNLENVTK